MQSLESRVEALEARIEKLEQAASDPVRRPGGRKAAPAIPSGLSVGLKRIVDFVVGDGAVARIGMMLLLVGVLFLVKYGIDQGWLNEVVRVILAAVAGVVLLTLGRKLNRGRVLAQVLQGGGVGALYIAVYSAHVFYGLIPFGAAIGLATLVTLLCLGIGLLESSSVLASVALAAGLSTPFVLASPEGSVGGLALYLLFIQLAAGVVYWTRHWTGAHFVTGVLATIALAVGALGSAEATMAGKLLFQVALLALWGVFSILVVVETAAQTEDERRKVSAALLALLAGFLPLLAWAFSFGLWDLTRIPAGTVAMGAAAGYGLAFMFVHSREIATARGSVLASLGLLASAGIMVLSDGEGFGLVALLGLSYHYLHRRQEIEAAGGIGGALFLLAGIGLFGRFMSGGAHNPLDTLYDGVGVVAMALCVPWSLRVRISAVVAWLLALFYLEREFELLGDMLGVGPGLATASWAALGIALLAAGARMASRDFRYGGLASVGLVVVKLLLFDLDRLDPVWRILIFLGIGIALLGASYLFPALFRVEDEDR